MRGSVDIALLDTLILFVHVRDVACCSKPSFNNSIVTHIHAHGTKPTMKLTSSSLALTVSHLRIATGAGTTPTILGITAASIQSHQRITVHGDEGLMADPRECVQVHKDLHLSVDVWTTFLYIEMDKVKSIGHGHTCITMKHHLHIEMKDLSSNYTQRGSSKVDNIYIFTNENVSRINFLHRRLVQGVVSPSQTMKHLSNRDTHSIMKFDHTHNVMMCHSLMMCHMNLRFN